MENEIVKKLDESVLSVLGSQNIAGFEKSHIIAKAIGDLKEMLTPEYMKPIMALQGNRLGFRTDKDRNKDGSKGLGYPMEVVRDCLIEAVLMGLQPTGNQFNIIAGNTYPTKEGCGYLLNNYPGLTWDLVCSLPKINADKTGAAVDVTITWTLKGETKTKVIPIAIRMDSYTSIDAVIGKATRKGRAWLLGAISGTEITDGDVEDAKFTTVSSVTNVDPDELQFQFENKKELLKPDDAIEIERILKDKVVASYPKVKKLLESI